VVLAVDPGRVRCGVAVVTEEGKALYQAIVSPDGLVEEVGRLKAQFSPRVILVGKGTGSAPLIEALERVAEETPIVVMEEAYTSEAARRLFVQENPARGWQKLLPRALRTPDRPYDDYAARILAQRWWQHQR
jgi:RNase H-fold protein (predicted Holliday junction resolvase)